MLVELRIKTQETLLFGRMHGKVTETKKYNPFEIRILDQIQMAHMNSSLQLNIPM